MRCESCGLHEDNGEVYQCEMCDVGMCVGCAEMVAFQYMSYVCEACIDSVRVSHAHDAFDNVAACYTCCKRSYSHRCVICEEYFCDDCGDWHTCADCDSYICAGCENGRVDMKCGLCEEDGHYCD